MSAKLIVTNHRVFVRLGDTLKEQGGTKILKALEAKINSTLGTSARAS